MQTFACPKCGHQSLYDPWIESARCPQCGYVPSSEARPGRRHTRRVRPGGHQPFLDELVAHWNGTSIPDPTFNLLTPDLAVAFFEDYQRAMGESPHALAGDDMWYVRNYNPQREEVLWFVGALLLLRRGEQAAARERLEQMTQLYPQFADPWIWLTAATDNLAQRAEWLENALLAEPAHPLARDAMSVLRGKVVPTRLRRLQPREGTMITTKCTQCGGDLHYQAGAAEVICPSCGHRLPLERVDLLNAEAESVDDLRLKRRYQGHVWADVQRILHCQPCGAELTMTQHLARRCPFCGSTNVLVEDNRRSFEQPDGFLPFAIDREQAAAAIGSAQRSGLRRIKVWLAVQEAAVQDLQGVYVPFWVFDGFVEARTWAEDGLSRARRGANDPGSDVMMFDNLLVAAFDTPWVAQLQRLLPFQPEGMVPYEPRLLADWPAMLYRVDVDVAAERAGDAMVHMARRQSGPLAVPPEMSAGLHPMLVRRSFQASGLTYQLVLLPIWIALLEAGGQRSRALVHGQSGSVAFGPTETTTS